MKREGDRDEAIHGVGICRTPHGQPHLLRGDHVDAARQREQACDKQAGTPPFFLHYLFLF